MECRSEDAFDSVGSFVITASSEIAHTGQTKTLGCLFWRKKRKLKFV